MTALHGPGRTGRNALRETLTLALCAELVETGDILWVVAPRLSNPPLLDNTTGAFSSLCADFPRTLVSLEHVLAEVVGRGVRLVVVTQEGTDSAPFLHGLLGRLSLEGQARVRHRTRGTLGAVGVVGTRFALLGTLRMAEDGTLWQEGVVRYVTEADEVRAARESMEREYGPCR